MSDNVWIVLIVALTVIVVLFLFRRQLSSFFLRAGKDGLETRLETRDTPGNAPGDGSDASVNISGTRQIGRKNKIRVSRPDVNISQVDQIGSEQQIDVQPDPPAKKSPRK